MKSLTILTYLQAVAAALLPHYADSTAGNVVRASSPGDSRLTTVYQYPNNTWVENITIRKDGKLLVTLITSPEVHLVDPVAQTQQLVYTFPNAKSATGIAELVDGLFAVAIGDWDPATFQATKGSWSVWTIDYRNHQNPPSVKKVTDIPEAYFLNGLISLPTKNNTVLIADSDNGVIYSLNTVTGSRYVAIDDPALKPNTSAVASLGVNGIHYRTDRAGKPYLYFTNTFSAPMFARIPLYANGSAAGASQTIVAHAPYPLNAGGQADDFTFDSQGNVYVASDSSGTLAKITLPAGNVTVVAGGANDSAIAGDTSVAFGRTQTDKDVLYIVTNGGMGYPPNGVVGGKVLAFNTQGL